MTDKNRIIKTKITTRKITKGTFALASLLFGIFSIGLISYFKVLEIRGQVDCYYGGDDRTVSILAVASFLFGFVGLFSRRKMMALIGIILSVITILMGAILVCM